MRLWLYVVRRVLLAFPVLIGVSTILFALNAALPLGDRLAAQYGSPNLHDPFLYDPTEPCPPPQSSQECPNPLYPVWLDRLGLDKPLPVQWATYVGGLFTLHWGRVGNGTTASAAFPDTAGEPVTSAIAQAGPYSLELGLLAGALLIGIALPLGRVAAGRRNQGVDVAVRGLTLMLRALPSYLLGSLLLLSAFLYVGAVVGYVAPTPWCPTGEPLLDEVLGSWPTANCFDAGGSHYPSWLAAGLASQPTGFPTVDALWNGNGWLALDTVLRLLLPAVTLALASMALLVRFVRGSMLEVLNLEYVRTARAQGIPESTVLRRHAARNTYNVTLTVMGLLFAVFLGWLPVVEVVFSLNGIGAMLAFAAQPPIDFGLIFGGTFLLSILVIVASLIVDLLYAYFDPRVRLG